MRDLLPNLPAMVLSAVGFTSRPGSLAADVPGLVSDVDRRFAILEAYCGEVGDVATGDVEFSRLDALVTEAIHALAAAPALDGAGSWPRPTRSSAPRLRRTSTTATAWAPRSPATCCACSAPEVVMDRRTMLAGLAGLPLAGAAVVPFSAAALPADPLVAMHQEATASLAYLASGADDGSDGDATFLRLSALREAAFDMRATGLPGALASLEWARMEFAAFYIDPQAEGDTPDWLDHFTLHLLDGAIGALRQTIDGGRG